ncbi:MAG: ABC transporter ATP-binding protein [Bacillaceae bacterium]|nr:ABC transporter ATP-binding protein [Bacillaceae bacterium]
MPMLQVKDLTKQFGGLTAVSKVSFSVNEGEVLGLIGPNGAGKTTCFNMIAGAMNPTKGQIEFEGQRIDGLQAHQISQKGIARTFQIVKPLRNLSVFDNVMIAALSKSKDISQAREIAQEVIDFTGIHDLAKKGAGELSIGNLKRLEVARALATLPRLLLLDEPMGGLNGKEVDQAIELILKINKSGKTVVIIEHIMKALMQVSDRIVVLAQGEKIAEGTPEAISKNEAVITAYLGEEYHAQS